MKEKYLDYIKFQSQLDLPFLETRNEDLGKIFNVLETKFKLIKNSKQSLIDLGSGNGVVVIFATLNYGIRSVGLEINENLVKESKDNINGLKILKNKLHPKIEILNEDFYSHSLNPYDFIYTYSLPTMQKYMKHIFKTAKSRAIIVSYKYPLIIFKGILKLVYELIISEVDDKRVAYYYERI